MCINRVNSFHSHVHPGKLTYFVHHGKTRVDLSKAKILPDVVFTTYETIENERRRGGPSQRTILSHHWRRIILDEGVFIPSPSIC